MARIVLFCNFKSVLTALIIFIVLVNGNDSNQSPNIVILIADDLGIGDVGCFGNITIRTPNIDNIASGGVKLTHHLTAAAVCTPSRAALLTGRYPVRQGMEASGRNKVLIFLASTGGLPPNEVTFAKALKLSDREYSTALIGKWHLGMNCKEYGDHCHYPLKHGFDYYYGIPLTNLKDFGVDGDSVVTTYFPPIYKIIMSIIVVGLTLSGILVKAGHFKQFFICFLLLVFVPYLAKVFISNIRVLNGVLMRNGDVVEQPVILPGLTQRLTKEATNFIDIQSKKKTPFLLVLSFVHVHTALFTDPAFANRSVHGTYGDNIEELDWAVGEVLHSLKKNELTNKTLLYFTSDNGGHLEESGLNGQREGGYNGKFRGGKCMGGMEGGIRVPSIISWPGTFPKGVEVGVPTSQMDIYPTLMDAVGLTNDKKDGDVIIDGKSILPLLTGSVEKSPHNFLVHYCGTNIHAVRYIDENGNIWKMHFRTPKFLPGTERCEYVCQCFGEHETHYTPPLFYNLKDDPYEAKLLKYDDPKYSKVTEKIHELLEKHKKSMPDVPSQFNFWSTLWRPSLQPCCNFPYCNCKEEIKES